MEDLNERKFDYEGDPTKIPSLTCGAAFDNKGDIAIHFDYRHVNPEQKAKLTLAVIKKLSEAAFDSLISVTG